MILEYDELSFLFIGGHFAIAYLDLNMLSDETFPFIPITTIDAGCQYIAIPFYLYIRIKHVPCC